jgi:CheY-like chemotaxis protein
MIIDDDADDRTIFCEALLEADCTCNFISAINGEHALQVLRRPDVIFPDFIFLDLNMPRLNGWQCLAQLRKDDSLKHIPVVIYSTSQSEEDYEKALKFGAVYFFTKPSRFADLVHGIFYVLNQQWEKVKELNKMVFNKS